MRITTKQSDALFECAKNAAYHSDRARFFAMADGVLNWVSLAAGTAFVGSIAILIPQNVSWLLGGTASLAHIAGRAFDFGGNHRLHLQFRNESHALKADIHAGNIDAKSAMVKLTTIYSREPSMIFSWCLAHAYNTAIDELGRDSTRKLTLRRYQIFFRNFYPAGGYRSQTCEEGRPYDQKRVSPEARIDRS